MKNISGFVWIIWIAACGLALAITGMGFQYQSGVNSDTSAERAKNKASVLTAVRFQIAIGIITSLFVIGAFASAIFNARSKPTSNQASPSSNSKALSASINILGIILWLPPTLLILLNGYLLRTSTSTKTCTTSTLPHCSLIKTLTILSAIETTLFFLGLLASFGSASTSTKPGFNTQVGGIQHRMPHPGGLRGRMGFGRKYGGFGIGGNGGRGFFGGNGQGFGGNGQAFSNGSGKNKGSWFGRNMPWTNRSNFGSGTQNRGPYGVGDRNSGYYGQDGNGYRRSGYFGHEGQVDYPGHVGTGYHDGFVNHQAGYYGPQMYNDFSGGHYGSGKFDSNRYKGPYGDGRHFYDPEALQPQERDTADKNLFSRLWPFWRPSSNSDNALHINTEKPTQEMRERRQSISFAPSPIDLERQQRQVDALRKQGFINRWLDSIWPVDEEKQVREGRSSSRTRKAPGDRSKSRSRSRNRSRVNSTASNRPTATDRKPKPLSEQKLDHSRQSRADHTSPVSRATSISRKRSRSEQRSNKPHSRQSSLARKHSHQRPISRATNRSEPEDHSHSAPKSTPEEQHGNSRHIHFAAQSKNEKHQHFNDVDQLRSETHHATKDIHLQVDKPHHTRTPSPSHHSEHQHLSQHHQRTEIAPSKPTHSHPTPVLSLKQEVKHTTMALGRLSMWKTINPLPPKGHPDAVKVKEGDHTAKTSTRTPPQVEAKSKHQRIAHMEVDMASKQHKLDKHMETDATSKQHKIDKSHHEIDAISRQHKIDKTPPAHHSAPRSTQEKQVTATDTHHRQTAAHDKGRAPNDRSETPSAPRHRSESESKHKPITRTADKATPSDRRDHTKPIGGARKSENSHQPTTESKPQKPNQGKPEHAPSEKKDNN